MRKLFSSILPLGVIILIMAPMSVCLGQIPSNYVIRNYTLVRENAQKTVESLLPEENEVARAPYIEATVKAFERYWGKGRESFDWKSFSFLQAELDTLEAEKFRQKGLLNQMDSDLARARQLILDTDKVTISNDEVMAYLKNRIEELSMTSSALASEIQQAQQTLSESQTVLEQRRAQLANTSSLGNEFAQAYAQADVLQDLIASIGTALSTDITSVNYQDIDKAEELYDNCIRPIETLSKEKYTIIINGMGEILPLRDMVKYLNNAVEAMGAKYDADLIQMYSQEIESLLNTGRLTTSTTVLFSPTLLSAGQKAQCQNVITELEELQQAAKNLNYLLDYILKQNPNGINSSTFDISSEIAKVVNIVNPSQSRYNPLFVHFNNILSALEDELKGVDMNADELKEYVQNKKEEL